MKAIVTKYLPATNTKPARIVATAAGVKHLIMSYNKAEREARPYGDSEVVHMKVAQWLCSKHNWSTEIIGGELPDGKGYAFVFSKQ